MKQVALRLMCTTCTHHGGKAAASCLRSKRFINYLTYPSKTPTEEQNRMKKYPSKSFAYFFS
ncbi:MAG: hypothetical protein IIW08_11620, partial [Clostridia bacterium]|nr:hypothetical protein [Clostridia bacterium]